MKFIFFILLVYNISFGQGERKYEFTEIEHKVNGNWECIDKPGDVIFTGGDYESIIILSGNVYREFYVIHKMLYTKINSLGYVLEEIDGERSSIKIVFFKDSPNLQLYFYSNRENEKHLKINLVPCK